MAAGAPFAPEWVRVDRTGGSAVLHAVEWPRAAWVAVPALAAGTPVAVWGALTGRAIEAGGGAVLAAVGALAAWLALSRRRDVVVARDGADVCVRGVEGAWPFRRAVDLRLPPSTQVAVVAFARPKGAPDVPDRGGDLVLAAPGANVRIARCVGPGWRVRLDAAAADLRRALGKADEGPPLP